MILFRACNPLSNSVFTLQPATYPDIQHRTSNVIAGRDAGAPGLKGSSGASPHLEAEVRSQESEENQRHPRNLRLKTLVSMALWG
jgi:hypothetical protein